jgi:hypothetical protein
VDLFERGRECLQRQVAELASYGVAVDPALDLRRATGLLCFYDLEDGQIHFSPPTVDTPLEALRLQLVAALLGSPDTDRLLEFFALFTPRVIAHELGHHLRHHHGLFGDDLWHEEQVANQLASALTKQRLSPAERAFAIDFLRTALRGLDPHVPTGAAALLAYDNLLDALTALGHIGEAEQESMEALERLLSVSTEQILAAQGDLATDLGAELDQRARVITTFNDAYVSNLLEYMYAQMSWTYVDLISPRRHYVDEFARIHLQRQPALLPRPQAPSPPRAIEVQACYRAAEELRSSCETAADYFEKRYRALLLRALQEWKRPDGTPLLGRATLAHLESWSQPDTDELDYAAQLAPRELRDLAPGRIGESLEAARPVEADLPDETDRRIWRHAALGAADEAAANTLERLRLLGAAALFRAVPAEAMLDLVHSSCRIHLAPGEALIWEGDRDNNLYVVAGGELDIFMPEGEEQRLIGTYGAGRVVGEFAFLTREPRIATVRARTATDCLVIDDNELQILCVAYPSILIEMARGLVHRIAPPLPADRKEEIPAEAVVSSKHPQTERRAASD